MEENNVIQESSESLTKENANNANKDSSHIDSCHNWSFMNSYKANDQIIIPKQVYDILPRRISILTDTYPEGEPTRDVALLTLLAHYSSICFGTSGVYHNQYYHPNLFVMVVGEAASGKGNAIFARRTLQDIDNYTLDSLQPQKRFIIAGNNSRANLIYRLNANQGIGMISETEADAISINNRSDWGNSSADHRCAFQNERISMERAADKRVIVIDKPRYAMSVTMTPGQVANMVGDRENGLFSRILFYTLDRQPEFTSPQSSGVASNRNEIVSDLSLEDLEWYKKFEDVTHDFVLSDNQWSDFTNFWQCRFKVWTDMYGQNESDLIFRLGLSSFKIAMILHTIELDNPNENKIIQCKDAYLEASLTICELLFYHGLKVTDYLDKPKIHINNSITRIIGLIPNKFTTQEYLTIAIKNGISERTAKRYLSGLIQDKIIIKIRHGVFEKYF
jgi:hypothetical protein